VSIEKAITGGIVRGCSAVYFDLSALASDGSIVPARRTFISGLIGSALRILDSAIPLYPP
jgi:hypothetical protein